MHVNVQTQDGGGGGPRENHSASLIAGQATKEGEKDHHDDSSEIPHCSDGLRSLLYSALYHTVSAAHPRVSAYQPS